MSTKVNCCPGAPLSVALLILGISTAAIMSHVSCYFNNNSSERNQSAFNSEDSTNQREQSASQDQPPAEKTPPKKVELGKNVFLEVEGDKRRVIIQSYVCLRNGALEQLLTRKFAKEHEAILAADIDAKDIHTALLACKATPGHPIKFQPKLTPPTGTVIKVTLEYIDKDKKTVRAPAQQWIRSTLTKKDLTYDWVFAGSVLIPDPLDKKEPPFYGANSGDVICVANMETALLDLPIASNRDNGDLNFEAVTERIPALETPVLIILEPVLEKDKK